MNKKLISILIANLFLAAPVFAQDSLKISGSVNLGGIASDDDDAVDPSKLNDIRDLSDGVLFGWDIKGRSSAHWFDFFGENIGRDDQYINLRGGSYGRFKYRLFSDSLTRNFLEGGLTPYAGAGTSNHTATGWPLLNTTTWNSVNVGYDRRDDGGYFEFGGLSPWYFRVDGNQVTTSGSKLGASSHGMSPGNGYVDLAFPVEYTTKNWTVEGGYATKRMHFSASWMSSKFETDNTKVNWTNGFWSSGTDTTYLGAGNEYTRVALNGTIRQLPLNSTLAARYTKDELESSFAVGQTVLGIAAGSPSGTAASMLATGPNTPNFDGKVDNETFTLALTSTPTRGLDTRIYMNTLEREDDSTHMAFTSAPVTSTTYVNEPYSYEKTNYGIDAFFRVNKGNRVGAGWDYLDMDRKDERYDYNRSKDRTWWLEWKTSMLENVSARVKYSNLDRSSDFKLGNAGTGPTDANYMFRFQSAFDAGELKQDKWKFNLDVTPAEFLDVGVEFNLKDNKYQDVVLGRQNDKRREIYGSVSYGDPSAWRFTVFGDYEKVEYESQHRVVGFPPGGNEPYNPIQPDTSRNYNWQGFNEDSYYAYGLAIDWPASEKLKLTASLMHYKTDGSMDFSTPSVVTAIPGNISLYDDTKRTAINLKGTYAFSKTISLTAGYAYEKFEYADAQFDGYRYTIPGSNRQDSYLMGYYKDPNYKANIFYGWVTWKF
ncbi:MAG: MtrB/PioB family outer membrane beta-barrel protein [Lysobacter sp.]|nr:MtrB/PioB family outer membrane beta-barrel protein [Lysobacter sp.]